jgi:hypothetical protein
MRMLRQVLRLVEDNPWGAFVFAFIFVLAVCGPWLFGADLAFAEFLTAVATAGGLLGVGHSVHRGAKHVGIRHEDDR